MPDIFCEERNFRKKRNESKLPAKLPRGLHHDPPEGAALAQVLPPVRTASGLILGARIHLNSRMSPLSLPLQGLVGGGTRPRPLHQDQVRVVPVLRL